MTGDFQIVIDCSDPNLLAHFWADALGYQIQGPPPGFASWKEYWISRGVPASEAGEGDDRISDPSARGPSVWFQRVEDRKSIKNRIHLDLRASGRDEVPFAIRRQRVEAEAARLVLLGATKIGALESGVVDHYAVAMTDPEGNEFDIN
ncbi:MAG: VOC family protein [Thermoplasmata archaeon]